MDKGLARFSAIMISNNAVLLYLIVSTMAGEYSWLAVIFTLILIPVAVITVRVMENWHLDFEKIGGVKMRCRGCSGSGTVEECGSHYIDVTVECNSCQGAGDADPTPCNADPDCHICNGSGKYVPNRFFLHMCACVKTPESK